MSMQAAAYAAQVLAALAAVLLARRHAPHRPAAVALVLLAASNVGHAHVSATLTPYSVEPWRGFARVLVYLDGALGLTSYAILAGLPIALAAPPERRRRAGLIVAGVWLLASVVLAALYPSPYVRGAGLQQVYVAADFVALAVAALALLTEARADIAARRSPSSSSAVATAFVLIDGGLLVAPMSPWRGDVFVTPYFGPQLVIAVLFSIIAATELVAWRSMSSHG
jgi:hypothetical protein